MLRTTREVRALRPHERAQALALCARDPAAYVYVAARLAETDLHRTRGPLLAYCPEGRIEALCWQSANLVPVECDAAAAAAFAAKVRRQQSQFSSVFGMDAQVEALWNQLRVWWREPMDIRADQPLLVMEEDAPLGAPVDDRVRPATPSELELIVPAAAAMFTEEIGYAPYSDGPSRRTYINSTRALIERGHCLRIVENDEVIFKAELGSVALGTCQVQGVWVAPSRRGEGLSVPAMAAVVAYARAHIAPLVTLYVNAYNVAAIATYARVGFTQRATFSTILL
ncbi:hypothetical protein BJY21_000528 [Kineosphaera limosa]|uniref:N-acetyltransferase domain-containing protein n=1 Tax=Kineosphaera limosa NBRC 100340 TaxID=1184609 RepID=K6W691_9MICO|nr:DUF4081 domain-containing GNAT family N-acetyltransferase [Kineosphaera limosa]NYD99343.1 hypothetical protein [Kineosphaera limosa]GAB94700.1 hypothetical protein KILIM_010_00310 [Kineosphaera limosa NBRC 100340]